MSKASEGAVSTYGKADQIDKTINKMITQM
jgi:hypothetical protein